MRLLPHVRLPVTPAFTPGLSDYPRYNQAIDGLTPQSGHYCVEIPNSINSLVSALSGTVFDIGISRTT